MGTILLRVFLYCAFIALVASAATWEGNRLGTASRYGEDSLVEYFQSTLLLATAGLFWLGARVSTVWRSLCITFVFAASIAAVREQDSFLDHNVFDGAWQLIAGGLFVAMLVHMWRSREALRQEVFSYEESRGAGLLLAGFLTVFVFSRIIGMQSFWRSVMGDGYLRVVKNFVEEGTELFGYSLLLLGAIETVLHLRRLAAKASTGQPAR